MAGGALRDTDGPWPWVSELCSGSEVKLTKLVPGRAVGKLPGCPAPHEQGGPGVRPEEPVFQRASGARRLREAAAG